MTEIQWIIQLLMNHELPEPLKKMCLERIGEVESKINNRPQPTQTITQAYAATISAAQLRDQQHIVPTQQTTAQAPTLQLHTPLASLGEITTGSGNGTSIRGPNKLRGRINP